MFSRWHTICWFLTNSHRIFSSNTDWFNSSLVAMQSNDAVAAPCPTPFLRFFFLVEGYPQGNFPAGLLFKKQNDLNIGNGSIWTGYHSSTNLCQSMEFQILVIEIRNTNISHLGKKEHHRLKHTWSGDLRTQMVAFTTIGC